MILTLLDLSYADAAEADGGDAMPEGIERLRVPSPGELPAVLQEARGEFVALDRRRDIALDGLWQSAQFARSHGCDAVRGLLLEHDRDGLLGVRGTDLLADPTMQACAPADAPQFLLDLRLGNLVVARQLLLDTLARDGADAGPPDAPAQVARVLLAARRVGRVPFVLGQVASSQGRPADGGADAAVWMQVAAVDALGPVHGRLFRAALALQAGVRTAPGPDPVLDALEPLWNPEAAGGSLEDWPDDLRLLVLSSLPDLVYPQLAGSTEEARRMICAHALASLVRAGAGEANPWLTWARETLSPGQLAQSAAERPADALPLLLAQHDQLALAEGLFTGQVQAQDLGTLDRPLLEQVTLALLAPRRHGNESRQAQASQRQRLEQARSSAERLKARALAAEDQLRRTRKQLRRSRHAQAVAAQAQAAADQAHATETAALQERLEAASRAVEDTARAAEAAAQKAEQELGRMRRALRQARARAEALEGGTLRRRLARALQRVSRAIGFGRASRGG